MDNEEKCIRDISEDMYNEYCCILKHISIKDIKMKERWSMLAIEAKIKEFLDNVSVIYENLNKLGLSWYPYTFNICLNEYGVENEYYIDIIADVLDVDIYDDGRCEHGDVTFVVNFNDDRIPVLSELGEVGYEEDFDEDDEDFDDGISDIDRLINGDDDDISDKPWLQ